MALKTSFGWKDIDVMLLGNIPAFINEITYKVMHEKANRYGRGNKPQARSRGNKTYEVSLIIGMEEAIKIEAAVRAKYGQGYDPTDLKEFDIPIVYDNGELILSDVIKDFEWTEWGRGGAQGDMEINMTVPGLCADILFSQPV